MFSTIKVPTICGTPQNQATMRLTRTALFQDIILQALRSITINQINLSPPY